MSSPENTNRPPVSGYNRRTFVAACVGSAALGASWMTGLALLARGRHPQLFVVGDDAWQVLLIEHGKHRIVILNGVFERSPEPEINRLCGVLRQRIHVVCGTGNALSLLSNGFRGRRAVDTMIQLDGFPGQAGSPGFVPLTQSIEIAAGGLGLQIRPLPRSQQVVGANESASWIAHVYVGELIAAIAPLTDQIADHGDIRSTLAIAATGDLDRLRRVLTADTIAVNASSASQSTTSSLNNGTTLQKSRLVRVFPRDTAAFVFRDGRIVLPDWTQPT